MTGARRGPAADVTGKPGTRRHKRRLRRLWKVTGSSLATFLLVGLLLFTIFFTHLEWQWVAFLSGILAASVLSLVTASLKSEWALARRTARATHLQERLSVESTEHAKTRERMLRAMSTHKADFERLNREYLKQRDSARRGAQAMTMLDGLSTRLHDRVLLLDRKGHCRFHTRSFSLWCGVHPARIDGNLMQDALPQRLAVAFREPLAQALAGKACRARISTGSGREQLIAEFSPHFSGDGGLAGVVLVVSSKSAPGSTGIAATVAPPTDTSTLEVVQPVPDKDAGHRESIARELTGWRDPAARVREAIRRDEFLLYAQNISPLRPELAGSPMQEIYIRMRDEEMKLIPPGAFLPVAEDAGMMPEIDRLVVRKVVAALRQAGQAHQCVCINLSSQTLEDALFPEFVARALQQGNLQADRLCFELEDGDAMQLGDAAVRQAHALKDIGCRISLSSFGALGLSFQLMQVLPLDLLKIDGRLILQMRRDSVALASVKTIVQACLEAGVRTVAELVESEDIIVALRGLGVDYAQGFGVAAPAPFLAPLVPQRQKGVPDTRSDHPDSLSRSA